MVVDFKSLLWVGWFKYFKEGYLWLICAGIQKKSVTVAVCVVKRKAVKNNGLL